ncbi:MAG: arginine--tRNA ligase [Spirochaetales bacterium]|nr:arginine--tRNA ligase [Spirochaetales bacterium]
MIRQKKVWQKLIWAGVKQFTLEKNISWTGVPENFPMETPPNLELGDLSFPLFFLGKDLRMGPPVIAQTLQDFLHQISKGEKAFRPQFLDEFDLRKDILEFVEAKLGSVKAVGPYLNIHFSREVVSFDVLGGVIPDFVDSPLKGKKVMVEFSCPNTNKPLHLGHLRNDALGESVSRILRAAGAEVVKVNLINNRGVHICKSMLAYQKFGENQTPELTSMKSDHFVGDFYVKFAQWEKTNPEAETEAQEMLQRWEKGEPEILELWKTMNSWAIEGIKQTYERTGISFDRYYFESDTYLLGRQRILEGLEQGIFYRDEEGTVWINLEEEGLDKKVLLRRDGTSLYITQDIGTAISRHDDYPFDSLVYVVASEQQYHFKVLFKVLERLGYAWAPSLYHLSYGMVNLPEGKMKSREGTVVDADDLLDQLSALAREEILQKNREDQIDDLDATAGSIALGALHYYLLQNAPTKDMIFNPQESLAFNGNTGPYLQYTGARISSMFRKWSGTIPGVSTSICRKITTDQEWSLVTLIGQYDDCVVQAAQEMSPSILTGYLFELTKAYSRLYHDLPILGAKDEEEKLGRLLLSSAVLRTLQKGMELINVPFLAAM